MRGLLSRLFFEHFRPTSFAFEEDGNLIGFLVGFRSQTDPHVAYIHFVGVSPTARGRGVGRAMYDHFFRVVADLGCREVHAITSPVNKGSIEFHRHLGFEIEPGDGEVDGVAVSRDYGGPGQDRVLFRRRLAEKDRRRA